MFLMESTILRWLSNLCLTASIISSFWTHTLQILDNHRVRHYLHIIYLQFHHYYYYYWYHCYLSTTTSLIVTKISSGILALFDSSKVVINDFTLTWFFHRLVARGKIYFFTRWPSSLLWYRFLFLLAIYDLLNGLSSLYRVETTCHQDHPLNVVRHLERCSVGTIVGIGG